MNRKISLTLFVFILLASMLFRIKLEDEVNAQTIPKVSVAFLNMTNSSLYEYSVGNSFRVNIIIDSPDIGIWSWQVGIHFNNTILECTDLGNGTFFNGRYTLDFQPGVIHNDLGYVTISGNSLKLPETEGVKGSGVLMWFQFHVKRCGFCFLDLTLSPPDLNCGTKLNERVDSNVVPISPIVLHDGWIAVTWLGDLDRDCDVDEDDLWYFCGAFIDYYQIHVLDPKCDFNKDAKIDEDDLWTFCGAFIDYWKAH